MTPPESSSSLAVPTVRPNYLRVLWIFARNSLVRDMTFRSNFIIECISSFGWMSMNLGFYMLIFRYTGELGHDTGWGKWEFFVFLSTTLFVNGLVEALLMPNAEQFSELIRTGGLDFALLKPIDTQFLISFARLDWSAFVNLLFPMVLLGISLTHLGYTPTAVQFVLYPIYVLCGVAILYGLMIALAATSVWLGRNQNLYDFWFYITNFSRYPREIYRGVIGTPLNFVFTFIVPVLIVVNVPARLLAMPLDPKQWWLTAFAPVAVVMSLAGSRWLFKRAIDSYRSASS